MEKDMEQVIRELKAKLDTRNTKIMQIDQKMIERQGQINKFTRYQEKATQPADTQRFELQKNQAQKELQELEQNRIEMQNSKQQMEAAYDRIVGLQDDKSNYLEVMEMEAKTNKNMAESIASVHEYEERVRRELAEAEALLELRKEHL
ncbi:hypothetical protein SH601_01450 [Gracilibacillus sp. S3-1-1]|uniref:Uncharacterized protein n=1 Tax=Gracilibacillus pellucidus TaxID=3095368 RepID=A0ACC6M116_9BACI|nr:hypothetical protein [Gracilibacillus sp. S3-1-1]MDX8044639.1 hypothetical protein [Gracilibacillus sp. S3-1-1]